MPRTVLVAGSLVLASIVALGCGDRKKTGDADASDMVEVADAVDHVEDVPADGEPDPVPDAEPDAEPDAAPDAGPDAEPDAAPDAEPDPADDGDDPDEDPALDAGDEADDATDVLSETSSCVALDPTAYGPCDMVIGVGWTGSTCEYFSGCSCSPDCAHFFSDITSCMAACMSG